MVYSEPELTIHNIRLSQALLRVSGLACCRAKAWGRNRVTVGERG